MQTTVHSVEGAASATPLRPSGGSGSGSPAPAERVTLSDEARLASRALPTAPSSQVRWYRAARGARPALPPAAPVTGRPLHVAVAAYLRQVPVAAQAQAAPMAQARAA